MPVTVNCHWCGKLKALPPSAVKERNFCNRTCFLEWRKDGSRLVHCAHCGEPKEIIASYPEREHYFCDTVCMGKWQSAHSMGCNHPRWQGDDLLVYCTNCGAPKRTTTQKIKDHERHFCNLQCKAEWQRQHTNGVKNPFYKGKVAVHCAWCKAPKNVYPHIAEMYDYHFCDGQCYGQWRAENIVGPNHPQYTGGSFYDYGPNWLRQRRKARNRDGYKCQHCGISQDDNGRRLDVHHITPFREYGLGRYQEANRLSNLISLCRSCHKLAEEGQISVQPRLL